MRQANSDTDRNETAPQVILLKMSHQSMKNYNYLVVDPFSNQAVIIDPAWQMENVLMALTYTQAELSGILITHAHHDHIDLAIPLSKRFNCPIWISKEEIAASGFNAEQLICVDKNAWAVGRMQIQPIFTPGHTPGSLCYLIADNLFSGDTLFSEGCGVCTDIHSAYSMYDSLTSLKNRVKPTTRVFPGHTYLYPPGQPFSRILQENIYLQFTNRNDFAAYRLRQGQNLSAYLCFTD